MKQLQEIYKKLNINENEFVKVKSDAVKLITENSRKDFTIKYGGFKGMDFALTDIEGKKVQLSDFKGKVVVLDFWATWCGPCRASFPYMQKMVQKYKGKPVAFLFINTGENTTPDETVQIASKFITEKKYDFNVLFDFEKEVSEKYQIKGIPTKIIIGKDGNLLSDSFSDGNMDILIDEQIK
jgi:thiol-disulfide isomerase/thioredoxin